MSAQVDVFTFLYEQLHVSYTNHMQPNGFQPKFLAFKRKIILYSNQCEKETYQHLIHIIKPIRVHTKGKSKKRNI